MADYNDKFIAGKQRIAQRRIVLPDAGRDPNSRLPPGQHEVKDWPVLDLGIHPDIPPDQWTLTLSGWIEQPRVLTWTEFLALPQIERVTDFHCVTSWSRLQNRWRGVAFRTLCELVRPKPNASYVYFIAYDDYSTNLPLSLANDDALLAHEWEGQPLPREHGGPVRVVVEKVYAWKGAKWVKEIQFLPHDRLGFWELRGYSNTANPWTDDRYA
ncbi:MAG: molybdopterin-dependent oxidoreductase [Verrucomicrobiae bacterium]|nr:molybdopterin-dependent oxidoreductase [Verrucomicrobiae bacterium]